jgi:hypothetical protein
MCNLLLRLQALNGRLDIALSPEGTSRRLARTPPPRSLRKDEIAFGPYDENYDTRPGLQTEHVGALAGAAGGISAGAAMPSIARRQVGIDQANRNAQAGRIRTARMQDRVAATKGISNERIGSALKTTGRLGTMGRLRNGSFRLNKRLARGGGRGIAAGVLGIGGALGGYAAGKLLNPATY